MQTGIDEPRDFGFHFECFADMEDQELQWIWPGVIPRGALSLIAGRQGLDKSYLICDIAARLSAGRALPGASAQAPMDILILSREDEPPCVLKPRLIAAQANLSRIHCPALDPNHVHESPSLAAAISPLIGTCLRRPFDLIIVDTAFTKVGGGVDAPHTVPHFAKALTRLARSINAGVVITADKQLNRIADYTLLTSVVEPGSKPNERRLRVAKTPFGPAEEQIWQWRFVGGDVHSPPNLEWSRDVGQLTGNYGPQPHKISTATIRGSLMAVICEGPQTLRQTIDYLREQLTCGRQVPTREDIHDGILAVIEDGTGDIDLWDGPRGAYLVGLTADRDRTETSEERALRLARSNPAMSAEQLRREAGCRKTTALQALRTARLDRP